MVVNKLESYLSSELNQIKNIYKNIYYMKLQVNQMAHKRTVADFLLLTEDKNYAIECKMSENDTFYFNRLTQEIDLQIFDAANDRCKSYVMLLFWLGNKNNSLIYVCTIKELLELKEIYKTKINVGIIRNQVRGHLFTYCALGDKLTTLFNIK